jgi:hypothetical protein
MGACHDIAGERGLRINGSECEVMTVIAPRRYGQPRMVEATVQASSHTRITVQFRKFAAFPQKA